MTHTLLSRAQGRPTLGLGMRLGLGGGRGGASLPIVTADSTAYSADSTTPLRGASGGLRTRFTDINDRFANLEG